MIVKHIKDNAADIYEKQGYDILDVPIEFKGRFEMDIQAALMNIAGISISHVTKFIPYPSLAQCYIEGASNPFTSNIISVGMKDSYMIQDFFVPERVPAEIAAMPIFIHIDASLTGDRTGIGGVAVPGYNYFNEYNIEKSIVMPTRKLMYRHVFSIGIQCPEGSEISFQKTRDFIYYLKFMLGWNIKGISLDGFQSADTKQQLISMGFEDTTIVSLDRTPDGYLMFKASLNEKRIGMLNIPELETEIIHLERDNMTGKVDHPVDGCFSYDTKVVLIDKKNNRHDIKIGEISENYDRYKDFKVIGMDENGKEVLTGFTNPRETKKVDVLLEIELDSGEIIECTPNHLFLCKKGENYEYIEAQYLTEDIDIVEPFTDVTSSACYLRSLGFSSRQIFDFIGKLISDLYVSGYSLSMISSELHISKTCLNGYLTSKGLKRSKSEAFINAKNHNRNCGSISKMANDIEYRSNMIAKASKNITRYNKSEKAKQEKRNRVISEETRNKLREAGIRKWKNPDYVEKVLRSNAGNKKYGKHQLYYSERFNREYHLKSDTERLFIQWFEQIKECTDVIYESIRIEYEYNGYKRIYVPDFLVFVDGKEKYLIEVKYDNRKGCSHDEGENLAKYNSAMEYCRKHSLRFMWLFRKDIGGTEI